MLYAYPFGRAIAPSPELVYLRTLVVAIEALRSGVTCLLDDCIELPSQDHEQLGAMFQAYEDAGVQANTTPGHVINKQFLDTLPYARDFLPDRLFDVFRARHRRRRPSSTWSSPPRPCDDFMAEPASCSM